MYKIDEISRRRRKETPKRVVNYRSNDMISIGLILTPILLFYRYFKTKCKNRKNTGIKVYNSYILL